MKRKELASYIRTAVIFMMIMASLYVERKDCYNRHFREFFALELIAVIVLAGITLLSKKETKPFNIDRLAVICWSGFALYTLLADILVDKKFRFAEALIFAGLFLLGYAWNKSADKQQIIKDLERAVQWFLFALLILSILLPAESNIEGRFSGPIRNPSIYALYLCAIWAVLLGSLDNKLRTGTHGAGLIMVLAEMLATMALMLLSQSLTPMIALVAATFIWFFRRVRLKKGTKTAVKWLFIIGIAGIAGMLLCVVLVRNTGAGSNIRIIQKIQSGDISEFLSDRNYYWHRYLSEMNLFGHRKKPFLWDHRILPHNALIGMMYWYGVPSVIPYILMMMMAIEKSFRFADTSVPYAAVPFYSIVSFVIMSMADNVEQPFVWLPWIACYLMMAPILVMPVEEIEALKTERSEAE